MHKTGLPQITSNKMIRERQPNTLLRETFYDVIPFEIVNCMYNMVDKTSPKLFPLFPIRW